MNEVCVVIHDLMGSGLGLIGVKVMVALGPSQCWFLVDFSEFLIHRLISEAPQDPIVVVACVIKDSREVKYSSTAVLGVLHTYILYN